MLFAVTPALPTLSLADDRRDKIGFLWNLRGKTAPQPLARGFASNSIQPFLPLSH